MQQARIPFPAGVDVGETAVVQLVAEVQRELHVESVGIGVDEGGHDPRQVVVGGARSVSRSMTDSEIGPRGSGSSGCTKVGITTGKYPAASPPNRLDRGG